MDLSTLDDDSLVKKFEELRTVFRENIDNKAIGDTLNLQLDQLVSEMKKRNLDV